MKRILLLIIGVGLLVFVFYIKYYKPDSLSFLGKKEEKVIDFNSIATSTEGISISKISEPQKPQDGFIKYQNDKYSFYFYHSPEAKITEYDEGGGAMIITLENKENIRGMQVFVVPYWEKTISEKRFKADVPSGVRTDVEKIMLDGVEAVTFTSFDETLGATREVWVIRGGYLYEITTFQGVRDWFVPKMQTWKFI